MQKTPRQPGDRVRREIEEILAEDEVKAPLQVAAPRPPRMASRIGGMTVTSGHLVVLGMVTLIAAGFIRGGFTLPLVILGAGLFGAGYWMSVKNRRKTGAQTRRSDRTENWWRGQRIETSSDSGKVIDFEDSRPGLLRRWFKRGKR